MGEQMQTSNGGFNIHAGTGQMAGFFTSAAMVGSDPWSAVSNWNAALNNAMKHIFQDTNDPNLAQLQDDMRDYLEQSKTRMEELASNGDVEGMEQLARDTTAAIRAYTNGDLRTLRNMEITPRLRDGIERYKQNGGNEEDLVLDRNKQLTVFVPLVRAIEKITKIEFPAGGPAPQEPEDRRPNPDDGEPAPDDREPAPEGRQDDPSDDSPTGPHSFTAKLAGPM